MCNAYEIGRRVSKNPLKDSFFRAASLEPKGTSVQGGTVLKTYEAATLWEFIEVNFLTERRKQRLLSAGFVHLNESFDGRLVDSVLFSVKVSL